MPVVTDLQSWADQLEVVRLPAIDAELASQSAADIALSAEIDAVSQGLLATLADHSVRIDVANEDAWSAQDDAFEALSTIYQTGLDARLYTDTRIQQLRDEFGGMLTTWAGDLTDSIGSGVVTDVDAALAAAIAQVQASIAAANQIASDLGLDLDDIRTVSDQILDAELPSQRAELDNLALRQISTKGTLDVMLADFSHPSINAGLDAVQADLEESVRPLRNPIFRLPASNWCINPHHNTFSAKVPPDSSWFLTNDPEFGECIELPAGESVKIGPSFSTPFDGEAVYKLTLQCRVVGVATGGNATVRMGATTWSNPTTRTEVSATTTLVSDAQMGDILTLNWYITASATKALDLDGTVLRLTTSSTARRAFFYVDQPNNGTSLRLASLEIRDVTEAIEAADIANAIGGEALSDVLQAIDDVNAALEANQELLSQAGNWDFTGGWSGWATSGDITDNPKDMNDVLVGSILPDTDPTFPGAAQFTGPAHLAYVVAIPILPDQAFKVRLAIASDIPCDIELVMTSYSLVGTQIEEFILAEETITATTPWQEVIGEKSAEWGSNAARVRLSLRMLTTGATVTVGELYPQDVTAVENRARAVTAANEAATSKEDAEEATANAISAATVAATARDEAGDHATAAGSSATAAAVSASNAGTSATAANTARLNAETAESQAQAARDEAVQAHSDATEAAAAASVSQGLAAEANSEATDAAALAVSSRNESVSAADSAAGSAAAAQTSSLLAASVAARGTGVLSDQYLPYGTVDDWRVWSSGPTGVTDNSVYPLGNEIVFNIGTENAGIQLDTDSSFWIGSKQTSSYRVELDIKRITGNMNGAGVLVRFYTASGFHDDLVSFRDMAPGINTFPTGDLVNLAGDFSAPSGLSVTDITMVRVYVFANYNGNFDGPAAKNFSIHRAQIFPTTFVEAAIKEQATVIADLQGNAAAGYLIQAQAGEAVAAISLIAADGSGDTVENITFDAKNIIAKGTLSADLLVLYDGANLVPDNQFQADSAWGLPDGPYRSANSGTTFDSARHIFWDRSLAPSGLSGWIFSEKFPVKAEKDYHLSVKVATNGPGGQVNPWIRIRWFNGNGDAFDSAPITDSGAQTGNQTYTVVRTAPLTAQQARIEINMDRDASTVDARIGDIIARLKEPAGTLITPGSMTTDLVDTDDFNAAGLAVFGGTLRSDNFNLSNGTGWRMTQSGTLNAPHGAFGSLQIGKNELTVPASQNLSSWVNGSSIGNWSNVNTVTVNLKQKGALLVMWNGSHRYSSVDQDEPYGLRLRLNGSVEWTREVGYGGVGSDWPTMFWMFDVPAGSHTVRVDWYSGNNVLRLKDRTLVALATIDTGG